MHMFFTCFDCIFRFLFKLDISEPNAVEKSENLPKISVNLARHHILSALELTRAQVRFIMIDVQNLLLRFVLVSRNLYTGTLLS